MPKEKKIKEEQALENKCPSCTASISFNPTLGKWKCSYCGGEFTLEEMQKHSNNASTKEKNNKTKLDDYNDYISYRCESCGAEIIADEETSATFCVYCGNTAILKSKLSGKFNPNYIIPFKTEKQEAIDAFKNLSKGRPLMPKGFNNTKNIEKIRGVYIPFWLYDIKVDGSISMKGNIIETWRIGDTHYTKTSIYDVTRGGDMTFSLLPVDGSTKFDNDVMNSIEPFNYKELIQYNHAYLSGFYAEKYDTEGEEIFNEASKRAINTAIETLKNQATGYTSKTITSENLKSSQLKREYALLPVWMVNVKYNGELYIFAMNGQTGKFIGNIPLDKGKAILYTILILISSISILLLISYVLFMLGGN